MKEALQFRRGQMLDEAAVADVVFVFSTNHGGLSYARFLVEDEFLDMVGECIHVYMVT